MIFSGKTVLVTGAASGIGLATARAFCAGGARVALNFLPEDHRGLAAVESLRADGFDAIAASGDVGRAGHAEEMVREAITSLGGLDYLVNNAGTPGTVEPIPLADFDRITDDFWQTILATNLIGPFRCTHAAAEALRASQGAVVNTASVAGLGLRASSIAYAASKAALVNLTLNLARALAPDVRVNAVAPGFVESPWTATWPEERRQSSRMRSLKQRGSTPEDIADVILFLCAGTRMVNGETIKVDGGQAV